jgi:hypothetical protein
MPDPKSKARVDRLLRGEFRPDDLTSLFLYGRDHADGREAVIEIGDFIAHHDERDRGIVTRSTREWFAVVRYHMSRFRPDGVQPFNARMMPSATPDYFKIAVNRLGAETIQKVTGLRKKKADEMMQKILPRLVRNSDGTWSLPADLSKSEVDLIVCVSSEIVVKPAFSPERICDDFLAMLRSNALISKEDERAHAAALRVLIQLCAIAAMHHCIVQVGDGTTVQLNARPEPAAKQIKVEAAVPHPEVNNTALVCSMFTADLDPAVHCHEALAAGQDWNFEIELAPDRRLSRL